MGGRRLTAEGFARAAEKFGLLADPTRLRILDLLRSDEHSSVNRVAERLGCSQPTASRHLSKMHAARLVGRKREGKSVLYFIEDDSIFQICEAMCGRLEREELAKGVELFEGEDGEVHE